MARAYLFIQDDDDAITIHGHWTRRCPHLVSWCSLLSGLVLCLEGLLLLLFRSPFLIAFSYAVPYHSVLLLMLLLLLLLLVDSAAVWGFYYML